MAGLIAPDVGNLAVGKGFILFKPTDQAAFYHVGNVPTFTFTPKATLLDHYSSMAGTRIKDLTITTEKSGEVKMDMEELTAQNLAMLVLGTVDTSGTDPIVNIFARPPLVGELKYYATNEVGPRWYVDLLSVTFNPSGDFSPITDNAFAKLPVTGSVTSVNGVFGTMTLKKAVGTVAPENVLLPSITGMTGTPLVGGVHPPKVGDVLTANVGAWIGVTSFTYAWKAGAVAAGGTPNNTANYTPVSGDATKVLTCDVTGTNSVGPTIATTPATLAVIP